MSGGRYEPCGQCHTPRSPAPRCSGHGPLHAPGRRQLRADLLAGAGARPAPPRLANRAPVCHNLASAWAPRSTAPHLAPAPRCPATPTRIAPPGDLARRSARPPARVPHLRPTVAERRSQGHHALATPPRIVQEQEKGVEHDDRDEADGDGGRDPRRHRTNRVGGRARPSQSGRRGDGDRRRRRSRAHRAPGARGLPGRRPRRSHPQALQAGQLAAQARRAHGARDRRAQDRRRALRADRRAVHRRVARPDADDGARRRAGRRDDGPRRRVQAAHEPVRVPGPGAGGPAPAGRGQGADRACRW